MKSAYEIRLDVEGQRLDVIMRGGWDAETLDAFREAMSETIEDHRNAGLESETLTTLVDMTDYDLQPPEIAEAMRQDVKKYERLSRHVALVTSDSADQRMQMRRIAPQVKNRFFTDYDCAEEWLRKCAASMVRRLPMPPFRASPVRELVWL